MTAPPMFGFTAGDVVVVTGAGSGIGRSVAHIGARMGLHVAAWDRDAESVGLVADEIVAAGGQAVPMTVDVGVAADIEEAMARSATLGLVRHLVNNAGPPSTAALDFDDGVRLCVGSVRRVTEAWLTVSPAEGGSVVNIASVAGNVVGSSPDWYPTAKAGITGYTRHLATYRSDRLRANSVGPGMTDTPRLAGFALNELGQAVVRRIPLHRMGTPDEMAYVILFLLSPLAGYVNGAFVPVDGGWTVAQ